ncbi:hypothetical protein ACWGH2_41845 [Streptomyces sp. NPDC054871]
MNTDVRTTLYPLITAGQSAVRAAEQHGSPKTVAGLDKALGDLPVAQMDDQADHALHDALRAVGRAYDAEEWELLAVAERAVSQLIHEPDGATLEHPAVMAVAMLTSRCAFYSKRVGAGVGAAWNRGYMLGLEAMGAVNGSVYGYTTGKTLDKAMVEFLAAVRRAIPYAALYATRNVLAAAARSYGLFVVGMRQPPAIVGGRWEWERVIGDATYLFEVEQPMIGGAPYGAVAFKRIAEDGTASRVRYIPLGPDEKRRRAVTEAQYRI